MISPQNPANSYTILRSKMEGESPGQAQLNLYKQRLVDQLNPNNPLL
jgi:hypothetical protein